MATLRLGLQHFKSFRVIKSNYLSSLPRRCCSSISNKETDTHPNIAAPNVKNQPSSDSSYEIEITERETIATANNKSHDLKNISSSEEKVAAAHPPQHFEIPEKPNIGAGPNFTNLQSSGNSSISSAPKVEKDKLYKTLELEVLAYEPSVLDSYQWFVMTAATHLNISVGRCWSPLKSDKFRFPLLKSAFVHKKHQVHYEVRTYHRFITLHKLTGSTADTFLEYIQRNLPEGCGLKVTKVEVLPLPEFVSQATQSL